MRLSRKIPLVLGLFLAVCCAVRAGAWKAASSPGPIGFLALDFTLCLFFLVLLLFLARRSLVLPLTALVRWAGTLGENGDPPPEDLLGRKDELGLLAGEMQRMAGELRNRTGELAHLNQAFSRDLNQGRMDRDQWVEREAYLRFLLESLPDLIAVLDRDYRIVDLNKGLGQDGIAFEVGKKCHEVFHASPDPCDCGEGGCGLQSVFLTGVSASCRHEHVLPGGRKAWVDVLLSPLRGPDGSIGHVIAAMRDVSREVDLQGRVAQAAKMEAVGTLAGGVAHEFNNILMTVMMNIEYAMAKTRENEKARESLSMSLAACHRARDLVEQLLIFSRKTDQELMVLSVMPVVKECLKMLRATLPTNVSVHEEVDARMDRVLASPTQVRELVVNLVTNAAQALEEQGGTIVVRLTDEHSPSGWAEEGESVLRLSVADDGPGMEPGLAERIFEPFFSTRGPGRGTGMGLSVVHGAVTALGGTVTMDSRPGKGTRFDVLLPLVDLPRAPEDHAALLEKGVTGTILVVDDDRSLVDTLNRALTNYGCLVVGRTRVDEALATFRETPGAFDLVIVDQVMPESSGLALAREVAAQRPDLPVVLCTGFSQEIPPQELARSGVWKVIRKPVATGQLLEIVTRLLKQARQG
ncbi:MAG: response regulator [Proteobacteria bacterium]|nr:response regulator [Pseudomonadota bacterium]